ncbi:MAG: hypothetical protein RLZZ08_1003 [Pseudomonadota bacterium]
MAGFLCLVFLIGGASRSDVYSLLLLRPMAAIAAVFFAFSLSRDQWRQIRTPGLILAAAALFVAVQLVPLPPALWHILPGRSAVVELDRLAALGNPWRPWSLTPQQTQNALLSLLVPAAALFGTASMDSRGRRHIATVLLALIGLSAAVCILQLAGGAGSPLYFYKITNKGMMVGLFANRNHNAVVLACALPLLAFTIRGWMQQDTEGSRAKAIIGGLVGLVLLPILAVVGSRMGFALGLLAFVASGYIVARKNSRLRPLLRRYRSYLAGAGAVLLAILAAYGVQMGRAVSGSTSVGTSEIRFTIWQGSWNVLKTYFPAGSGFGSFPDVYKAGEPLATLEPSYINHAHNDFLEIAMDGGVIALALLAVALIVFAIRFMREFQVWDEKRGVLPLVGGVVMLVFILASASDYPLRVPSVMAMMAIASVWLFADRADKSAAR